MAHLTRLDETRHLERVCQKNNHNSDPIPTKTLNLRKQPTTQTIPVTTATIGKSWLLLLLLLLLMRPQVGAAKWILETKASLFWGIWRKGLLINITSPKTARQRHFWNYSTILQPYDISVAHKVIATLLHMLTNVKDKDQPCNKQGETGRNERKTDWTTSDQEWWYQAESHRPTKQKIVWYFAECVTYSTNYQQRLTLGSWFTNLEKEPLNRCQQLPAPYKRLIHNLKGNRQTTNGSKETMTQHLTNHYKL